MAVVNTISKKNMSMLILFSSQPPIKKKKKTWQEKKVSRKPETSQVSISLKSKAPRMKQEENQSRDHHTGC